MDDELYGGSNDSTPMQKGDASAGDNDKSPETYLINKSVCPDMKVGDEMVVKIEAIHEKEYEVSYAPEEGHTDEGPGKEGMAPEAPAGAPGGGEAESMYG